MKNRKELSLTGLIEAVAKTLPGMEVPPIAGCPQVPVAETICYVCGDPECDFGGLFAGADAVEPAADEADEVERPEQ